MDADEKRELDTSIAYSARVNNYWQGGKDNFAADREAARQAIEAFPELPVAVRGGARFRARVVEYLIDEGVRQFLDLGAGLPAGDPVHVIAQSVAPESRVFYVDHDPMVISHAKALFRSTPEGACGFLQADVRDTGNVLDRAAEKLDFGQPVAVLLVSLLHLIADSDDPYGLVRTVLGATAPGSHLVIVHPASDIHPEASSEMQSRLNELMAQQRTYRDRAEVTAFFEGLELVEPGVVPVPKWRQDDELQGRAPALAWCGVARKA